MYLFPRSEGADQEARLPGSGRRIARGLGKAQESVACRVWKVVSSAVDFVALGLGVRRLCLYGAGHWGFRDAGSRCRRADAGACLVTAIAIGMGIEVVAFELAALDVRGDVGQKYERLPLRNVLRTPGCGG